MSIMKTLPQRLFSWRQNVLKIKRFLEQWIQQKHLVLPIHCHHVPNVLRTKEPVGTGVPWLDISLLSWPDGSPALLKVSWCWQLADLTEIGSSWWFVSPAAWHLPVLCMEAALPKLPVNPARAGVLSLPKLGGMRSWKIQKAVLQFKCSESCFVCVSSCFIQG